MPTNSEKIIVIDMPLTRTFVYDFSNNIIDKDDKPLNDCFEDHSNEKNDINQNVPSKLLDHSASKIQIRSLKKAGPKESKNNLYLKTLQLEVPSRMKECSKKNAASNSNEVESSPSQESSTKASLDTTKASDASIYGDNQSDSKSIMMRHYMERLGIIRPVESEQERSNYKENSSKEKKNDRKGSSRRVRSAASVCINQQFDHIQTAAKTSSVNNITLSRQSGNESSLRGASIALKNLVWAQKIAYVDSDEAEVTQYDQFFRFLG